MQGVFQNSSPTSPYLDKILALSAQTNIHQITYCIQKCQVLQDLSRPELKIQDKICLDRCASKINFDVDLEN